MWISSLRQSSSCLSRQTSSSVGSVTSPKGLDSMTPLGRSDSLQLSRLTLHLSGVVCPLPKRPLGPHPSPLSRDMYYIVTAVRWEKFLLGRCRVGEPDALTPRAETGDSLAHINAQKELEKLLTRHKQLGRGDRRVARCCRCQSEGTDARSTRGAFTEAADADIVLRGAEKTGCSGSGCCRRESRWPA